MQIKGNQYTNQATSQNHIKNIYTNTYRALKPYKSLANYMPVVRRPYYKFTANSLSFRILAAPDQIQLKMCLSMTYL